MDYSKICFVVMPFGTKAVADKQVDFDQIYDNVFAPAISGVVLPEGGSLEPRRTDKDFYSSDISIEMFRYLEYSRFVVADISGLNANVFYELGARHRARESGTAIFRQAGSPLPFDINKIKAFPYEYEPEENAQQSRELIREVLSESLVHNRIDSPVRSALQIQEQFRGRVELLLRDAENALRNNDRPNAILRYREASKQSFDNPLIRMNLGLLLKEEGQWAEALEQFAAAITYAAKYSDAFRERGIAENKLYYLAIDRTGLPDGEGSLSKAVELNPEDFDAWSSLAGIQKRAGKIETSLQSYAHATAISRGHSYPLLNELTLEAHLQGRLSLNPKREHYLTQAERSLRAQISGPQPYNPPWSYFDLSQLRLFRDDEREFIAILEKGLEFATSSWMPKTYADTLTLLPEGFHQQAVREGIKLLIDRAETVK